MQWELDLIAWFQANRNSFLDALFQFFTLFGEEMVLIVILGFLYWCYNKKEGEIVGLTIFSSIALNSLLKVIIARPRPFMVDERITNLKPSTSQSSSMPSGHTQTAATTYFSLNRLFKNNWMLIIASMITLFVAVSRMYLGVHYFTDVLVGAMLGIIIALNMPKILNKIKNKRRLYNIIIALVNVALIIVLLVSTLQRGSDSIALYEDNETIFKMFGTITGFFVAINFEEKHVHFENHQVIWKNAIRFLLGLGIIMLVRVVLSYVFDLLVNPETLGTNDTLRVFIALACDYIRYTFMLFIGIGLYPKLFKTLKI